MSLEFEFPDTGEGVTEGQFLEWTVDKGDEIEEDQVVAEVETDKAVVDIPAPTNGVVKDLRASPGDKIKVGDVIMVIDDSKTGSEDTSKSGSEESDENVDDQPVEEPEETLRTGIENDEISEEVEAEKDAEEPGNSSNGDILALPKVRKLAEEKGVDLASVKTGERITQEEVLDASGDEKHAKTGSKGEKPETGEKTTSEESEKQDTVSTSGANASPSVRRLAREKGIDLSSVEGGGRGGTVTRNDVLEASKGSTSPGSTTPRTTGSDGEERIELTSIQKHIGERMSESKYTAPHVTHVDKADVTELVELRNEKKDKVDVHLTYMPFIVKAVMLAMKDYPELNAELDEENDEIVLKKHYDFNIAVDTDRGLMVPLIEVVDEKNIVELAAEIGDKAGAAMHGDLGADDMRNGTFSITNLGVIGGEEFTPIINYPQTSILGVGKIQETAEVVEGEVIPRHTVKLSLSYDHRVIDGATAARFMNEVIENLEDPGQMLLEL